MNSNSFFSLEFPDAGWTEPVAVFEKEYVQKLISDGSDEHSDLDIANALTALLHEELEEYGTAQKNLRLSDTEVEFVIEAAYKACARIGLEFPELPFKNFTTFMRYWISNGMSGSWQLRREYLSSVFEPTETEMNKLTRRAWSDDLADAVSPRGSTGWSSVDKEIRELRMRFKTARTPQDYSLVGAASVRVLEAVGEAAFDPGKHLEVGDGAPHRDKPFDRFDRIIAAELRGRDNGKLRALAKAAVAMAHSIKHSEEPSRSEAGIAADTSILVANIFRRIRDTSGK